MRAPDHGKLRPWRFLTIQGDARAKLGDLYLKGLQPETEERTEKLLNAPFRAPLIIVAVTTAKESVKVPRVEQVSSTAAAVQNMSIAIFAMGFASIWRTGEAAFNDVIKEGLGLSAEDEIVGYLYIGTPTVTDRKTPEEKIEDYFNVWP